MSKVSFSPRARQDLIEIGEFIARDSRANARNFVGQLREQCQRIARAPLAYPGRDDLSAGLRMAALDRYAIFFRIIEGDVRIERVLHGARNLPALLGSSGASDPER